MSNLKILFVASGVEPFINEFCMSKVVRDIARKLKAIGADARIIVPKFGVINDRRNKLHEVVRLSGINIPIDDDDMPLIIKVASIREERLQVYFIDNEDYFKRRSVLKDKNGKFHPDNDERLLFFSKGILETIKQLEWSPNILHCNGWMSSFVPFFLKTSYAAEPAFKDTKTIYNIYDEILEIDFSSKFLDKEPSLNVEKDIFESNGGVNFESFISLGAKYSDYVVKTTEELPIKVKSAITPYNDIKHISHDGDYMEDYKELYKEIMDTLVSTTA